MAFQEQSSTMVEWVEANLLKPHPKNEAIYGEDGFQDLVDSISELGVLQAIYARPDNVVISGHRRWRAAKEVGKQVPVIRVKYPTELDELQAIIEHNRYRIKNGQQLYNEGEELEKIEVERASERMKMGKEKFPYPDQLGQSRDIVAKTIGLGSGKQWDKLKYVAEHKPELLKDIKPEGISIHRAWKLVDHEVVSKPTIIPHEPEGLFSVIAIDPPWPYQTKANDYDPEGRVIAPPYMDMSIEDIQRIKLPMAENCIVFLWVTNAFMHEAYHCLEAWGLTPKTILTWFKGANEDKVQRGVGHWLRGQTEHCIMAVRGKPRLYPYESSGTAFFALNKGHSKKPDEFFEMINRICPGRKLEWFSRLKREGWEGYGNQSQ